MDDGSRLPLIFAVLLLLCAVFFAVAETAFASTSRTRIRVAEDRGDLRAKEALYVLDNFDLAISAILIGTNITHLSIAALVTLAVTRRWGLSAVSVSTLVTTGVVFFFGEMLPKSIAKKFSDKLALATAGLLVFFMKLFRPVSKVLTAIGRWAARHTPGDAEKSVTEEELYDIIEDMTEEGTLNEEQGDLISSALQFGEVTVENVLTPRVDLVAIDLASSHEKILDCIKASTHSRLPVYEGSIDNIIGVLYLNHFLKAMTEDGHTDIRSLLMPPCFVYKTMKLPAVLSSLKKARQHLAIVSDEYGGTLGVLSMEDVLEQIVGDIWDETDTVEQEVVQRSESEYELDGDMVIADFLELLGIDEDSFEAESETVGGWTVESFGAFPQVGDSFTYENWRVTVLAMDGRRVEKVLVQALPETEDE